MLPRVTILHTCGLLVKRKESRSTNQLSALRMAVQAR